MTKVQEVGGSAKTHRTAVTRVAAMLPALSLTLGHGCSQHRTDAGCILATMVAVLAKTGWRRRVAHEPITAPVVRVRGLVGEQMVCLPNLAMARLVGVNVITLKLAHGFGVAEIAGEGIPTQG